MKAALGVFVFLLSLSVAASRFQRSKIPDDNSRYDLRNDLKHTYYVLIKEGDSSLASAEVLSEKFSKQLGDDSNVRIVPGSKVRFINFC
jgi:hypothetical protein